MSVSFQESKGGWRVRWREEIPGPDGKPHRGADGRIVRRDCSRTVGSKAERDVLLGAVRQALLLHGRYDEPIAPVPEAPPKERPTVVASADEAYAAFLRSKATRCARSSWVQYRSSVATFFDMVREILAIPEDEPVPINVLSRDLISRCAQAWTDAGRSESRVYALARIALEGWRWAAAEPHVWLGVPVAPDAQTTLPRTPLYLPTEAPSWAHIDACLRHMYHNAGTAKARGVLMRFTGLRIAQVIAVQIEDVDLATSTFVVRAGKSRREKAMQRRVPISTHLLPHVREWIGDRTTGPLIARRGGNGKRTPATFKAAWESATLAGEVPRSVWFPPNRAAARPEHAFRAAFQDMLRLADIPDVIIDALVGHNYNLRDVHYSNRDVYMAKMRLAVDGIPPVDWDGPRAAGKDDGKVVRLPVRV